MQFKDVTHSCAQSFQCRNVVDGLKQGALHGGRSAGRTYCHSHTHYRSTGVWERAAFRPTNSTSLSDLCSIDVAKSLTLDAYRLFFTSLSLTIHHLHGKVLYMLLIVHIKRENKSYWSLFALGCLPTGHNGLPTCCTLSHTLPYTLSYTEAH